MNLSIAALDLDINRDPVWQVGLSSLSYILGETGDFSFTVELGRDRNVHPLQGLVLVLGLSCYASQVREELLYPLLEIVEGIRIVGAWN